ncbi:GDSL-type esterase/lipase family protein [Blastococcus goldschmidtiae]|uniref:GDSL-type esterase/lipase family protein n=1 Tax=Blastococcus goldschmidtiae TaxID=3075546 RepID=A0ABU2KCD6_9ACTN|nr:GDSL-type esterase/lipase family protein [Blastococcus sp. DSM 46792]MDT0277855.1 GDSL-type esterase/lipase family protein [Blastococcus sp. DSM 46792]
MPRDLRICFIGDSFVAGVGDPEQLGWAGRLTAGSARDGLALTSYVLGVRRQTTAEIAGRWAAECRPRLAGGEWEARIVLSAGVNDTTEEHGAPRLAPDRSVAALEEILTGAAHARWPLLVVGPPAVADAAQNERIAELDNRFAQACARRGVPYVAVVTALAADPTWTAEVAAGDGAHPGTDGYAVLAGLVRPHWQRWITG